MKMIEGQNYLLKNDKKQCKCKLTNIQTYPASAMPPDYMFTPLEGEEPLAKHEHFYPSFPIPQFLIFNLVVAMLDDNGEELSKEVLEEMSVDEILNALEECSLCGSDDEFNRLIKELPNEWYNDNQKTRYISILQNRIDALEELKIDI